MKLPDGMLLMASKDDVKDVFFICIEACILAAAVVLIIIFFSALGGVN